MFYNQITDHLVMNWLQLKILVEGNILNDVRQNTAAENIKIIVVSENFIAFLYETSNQKMY